jgi:hypothetical protein
LIGDGPEVGRCSGNGERRCGGSRVAGGLGTAPFWRASPWPQQAGARALDEVVTELSELRGRALRGKAEQQLRRPEAPVALCFTRTSATACGEPSRTSSPRTTERSRRTRGTLAPPFIRANRHLVHVLGSGVAGACRAWRLPVRISAAHGF